MTRELPYARKLHRTVHNSKESLLCPRGSWCRIKFDTWGEHPMIGADGREWESVHVEADRSKCCGLEIGGILTEINGTPTAVILSVQSGPRPTDHEEARSLFRAGALGHRAWGTRGLALTLPCTSGMEKRCGYPIHRVFPLGAAASLHGWTDPTPSPRTLWLSAEPPQDVYSVRDSAGRYLGYACVPSYADSVRLNETFRRIRENRDLDLQEVSDAEDDFEDSSPYKFVCRAEPSAFHCVWRQKERKWFPVKPAPEHILPLV